MNQKNIEQAYRKLIVCGIIFTIILCVLLLPNKEWVYSAYSPEDKLTLQETFTKIATQGISYKFNELERPSTRFEIRNKSVSLDFDYVIDDMVGSSMFPTLKQGDILLMKRFSTASEIKDGFMVDCVEQESDYTYHRVVHRVVGVYEDFFYLQGDRNAYPDENYCYPSRLNGYVVGIIYGREK